MGFFGYFASLLLLIRSSDNFNADFLLDGRRREITGSGYYIPGDFTRPPMLLKPMVQGGDNRDGATAHAQMPMMAPHELAPVIPAISLEESRQAQATAEALRVATLDAQRTLAALTQAGDGPRLTGLQMNPTLEPGDEDAPPISQVTRRAMPLLLAAGHERRPLIMEVIVDTQSESRSSGSAREGFAVCQYSLHLLRSLDHRIDLLGLPIDTSPARSPPRQADGPQRMASISPSRSSSWTR